MGQGVGQRSGPRKVLSAVDAHHLIDDPELIPALLDQRHPVEGWIAVPSSHWVVLSDHVRHSISVDVESQP